MRIYRQESPGAQPVLARVGIDSDEPCVCGWAPEVNELVEVIVRTREEARQVMAEISPDRSWGNEQEEADKAWPCVAG